MLQSFYKNEADPENDLNISTCIETAERYLGEYDSIKDSYSSETSIFDMSESISGQMATVLSMKWNSITGAMEIV